MSEVELRAMVRRASGLAGWHSGRTQRISSGFYTSQALEVVR
jgi:magnesium-protoporphyrin O-methyltransferase